MPAEAVSICPVVLSGVCTALGTPWLTDASPLLSFWPSSDMWYLIHHALPGGAQLASHFKGNCLCCVCYVVDLVWPRYDELSIGNAFSIWVVFDL